MNNMKIAILNCHELTRAIWVPRRLIKPLGERIIEQRPDILFCPADWVKKKWMLEVGAQTLGKRAGCRIAGISNKSGSTWVYIFKKGRMTKEKQTRYGFIAFEPTTLKIEKVKGERRRTAKFLTQPMILS